MAKDLIQDNSVKDWRTEIPNSIIKGSKADLSLYAKWLYVYIKSVAGENGKCWQSTKTLAKGAGMSAGKVSDAKKELRHANLITIEYGDHKKGKSDVIRICDIWVENYNEYSKKDYTSSSDERTSSRDEQTSSSDEPKKEPSKNNPNKKSAIPEKEEVVDYFLENGYSKQAANKMYNYYQASVEDTQRQYWRDGNGNKVRNWKMKAQAVWFKPENEQQQSLTPSSHKAF